MWLAAAAFAVAGFMLRYHRLGRALYAIGGNPEAARAAGIRVERITWGVYVLAGVLAAVGGLEITGYVGAISANQGNGLIFTVFAAAVIGGISLDGGKGTMFGALTGVLLLGCRGKPADAGAGAVVLDSGDLRRDHPRVADGCALCQRAIAGVVACQVCGLQTHSDTLTARARSVAAIPANRVAEYIGPPSHTSIYGLRTPSAMRKPRSAVDHSDGDRKRAEVSRLKRPTGRDAILPC